MRIEKEKERTILSLTKKEFEELQFIISQFDGCNVGVDKNNSDSVALGRKWCKAVGIPSYGYVCNSEW